MALVDISLAIGYLKQDAGVDDDVIALILDGAESSVLDYLNRDVYASDDDLAAAVEAGTAGAYAMAVTGTIKVAILKTLAELYANRGDSGTGLTELPFNVKTLIGPLRILPGT